MFIRPLQTTMKTSAAGDGPAVCMQELKASSTLNFLAESIGLNRLCLAAARSCHPLRIPWSLKRAAMRFR